METKEQLIHVVKEWVTMDNDIRKHQQLVRDMKAKQKNVFFTHIGFVYEIMELNELVILGVPD